MRRTWLEGAKCRRRPWNRIQAAPMISMTGGPLLTKIRLVTASLLMRTTKEARRQEQEAKV